MRARLEAHPVARYLVQFDSPQPAEVPGENHHAAKCPEEPEPEVPSVLLQAAREEGKAEGYAKAQAEYEAKIQQEQAAHAAHLAAERDRWVRQEGERLSGSIKAIFAEIEAKLAGSVMRVLTPFVTDALRHRTVDLLSGHIRILLDGGQNPLVEIHGPEDLLNALREKLGAAAAAISYFPEDSADVRIIADQTLIESQLEAWHERIKSLAE